MKSFIFTLEQKFYSFTYNYIHYTNNFHSCPDVILIQVFLIVNIDIIPNSWIWIQNHPINSQCLNCRTYDVGNNETDQMNLYYRCLYICAIAIIGYNMFICTILRWFHNQDRYSLFPIHIVLFFDYGANCLFFLMKLQRNLRDTRHPRYD